MSMCLQSAHGHNRWGSLLCSKDRTVQLPTTHKAASAVAAAPLESTTASVVCRSLAHALRSHRPQVGGDLLASAAPSSSGLPEPV